MREIDIVSRIRKQSRSSIQTGVVQGIGDDCAVIRPPAGKDLVFTTDFLIENRHFTVATHSAAEIGHKALARSLSDLAAMGSEPLFCLVSLAVSSVQDERWIDSFYKGLLALAKRYKLSLAGGDLARAENVIADVMCCGVVPKGKALLRSGAKPEDVIYVTGQLGESALGLEKQRGKAWRRHRLPEPRIREGLRLRNQLHATAAMDLSDGLSLDLHRLCLESKMAAELNGEIPVAPGATLHHALHGGEDYELLFTAPPRAKVPAKLGKLSITRIGTIRRGVPGRILFQKSILNPSGFDHFQ